MTSCNKESELGDLSPNTMEPDNGIDVFVLDSIKTNPFPYTKIFYHIKYELIKDPSKIYKIVIYRNDIPGFYLLPTASNAFSPMDLSVNRFETYKYSFGLMEADNTISKTSASYYIYVP